MNRFLLFVLVATMIRGPVWAEDISKIIVKPNVKTATMGGVPVPSADVLRQMSLTICGSSMAGNSWAAVSNKTDFHAIKWQPVK